MGAGFSKYKLFFHSVSFIVNIHFLPLLETPFCRSESPELFMNGVFQVVVDSNNGVLGVHISGDQNDGSQRVLIRA